MKGLAIAIMVVLIFGAAWADVLEWRDADGVSHYTNLQAEIPKEQQQSVQVVVDERARQLPAAPDAACEPAAAAAAAPRREAEVVYDRSPVVAAYIAGVERGLAVARGADRTDEGNRVAIHGPLAVANASSGDPYYRYSWPYRYPLVTTPFDRGRSRYLTVRQLLDDQLQVERDFPFIFQPRLIRPFVNIGLGIPVIAGSLPRLPNRAYVVVR